MDDFDSATYSIESEPDRKRLPLDDVILPTVRRSAIQIVSLSPRRQAKRSMPPAVSKDNGTMQVTKLVLKTPPGSPKRQPKTPGVLVKSIQTLAAPHLTGGGIKQHGDTMGAKVVSVLTEKRNHSVPVPDDHTTAPYRIIPILASQNKDSKKEFEARRTEREHATHEFNDFLRESFKENKTPPSTPPLPQSGTIAASTSAFAVTRVADSTGSSDAESAACGIMAQTKSTSKIGIEQLESVLAPKEAMKTVEQKSQQAVQEEIEAKLAPTPAARTSLLMESTKLSPTTVQASGKIATIESINKPLNLSLEKEETASIMNPPKVNEESHEHVELGRASRSHPTHPKPPPKPVAKTAMKEEVKKKEKSYDPAKAREFMKEQQAKRRLEKRETTPAGTGTSAKGSAEKDVIRKRLETLRQSSQKLVSKNLQKARKRSLSCASESANSNKQIAMNKDKAIPSVQSKGRTVPIKPTMGLRKFASTPALRLVKRENTLIDKGAAASSKVEGQLSLKNASEPHSVDSRSSDGRTRRVSSTERLANPSIASSGTASKASHKMGILRKPDSLNLEDLVPDSPLKQPHLSPLQKTTKVNAQLILIKAEQEEVNETAENELKLHVPDVKLVPSNDPSLPGVSLEHERPQPVVKEDENHAVEHQSEPVKSIPSWLKQSLRQPDPYPFILAVRKKLEAVQNVREQRISHPAASQEKEKITQKAPSTRYHSYLNEIESVPFIRKATVADSEPKKGIPINKRPLKDPQDGESAIVTKISACSSPNTTSDISSIKSDIALPLPPLLSSTKIETLPPASSPFHLATANGPVSPLSVERISQMKIASPGSSSTSRLSRMSDHAKSMENKYEEKARPQTAAPRQDVTLQHQLFHDHPMDRSQRELEYQRLLESFNRSLTHVIEVNQQLYSALKNVPCAPAIPPFPPEVLRIRDEMTQTSLAIPALPKSVLTSRDASEPSQDHKVSGASTTTASNYSDDFEHQSQTEVPSVPKRNPDTTTPTTTTTDSSTTGSSTSNSAITASDDTSDSNSNSSTQSSSSSSLDNEQIDSPRRVERLAETNATDDEHKAKSNTTTTAHSSDFDSRSFSLSDSHNNTMNNQPPLPEEYLPSFEESLRRKQMPKDKHNNDIKQQDNGEESVYSVRDKDVSQESTISEQLPPDQEEEQSFSMKLSEKANDDKVSAVPKMGSLSEESIKKNTLQVEARKNTEAYEENLDATINSDLLAAMFNRTDLEVSILSTTVSETNLSYSSIGMFDQLIHTERSKEDHLVSRVQSKQKALLSRAKGQLAWLELQKQRYREKGMAEQITAVKKKQRAILLRLEKDRAELNRALKSSTESSRTMTANHGQVLSSRVMDSKLSSFCSSPVASNAGSLTLRKSSRSSTLRHQHSRTPESPHRGLTGTATTTTSNSIQIAIRGRELEPNDRLEDILLRREEELRKRKEHVQRLLEWHRKLEREEEELIAVEDRLLAYNSRKLESANTHSPRKEQSIEARVERIENSLRILQSIPTTVVRKTVDQQAGDMTVEKVPETEEETVLTRGSKLNRLWQRLTGVKEQRYEPSRNYPITRLHMATLYEDAKRCVLEGFQRNDVRLKEALLEHSIGISHRESNETVANTTGSLEENGSLQTTVTGEETVRNIPQEAVLDVKETVNDVITKEMNESSELEQKETVAGVREKTDATVCDELAAMEEDGSKCLLSSTVNGWSPNSRRSIESVEFHTLEETPTQYQSTLEHEQENQGGDDEAIKSESYSMTFEEHSHEGAEADGTVAEVSQQLIEDMSLPPMLLNYTTDPLVDDEESTTSSNTSSCESSATVELSVPLAMEEKVVPEKLPTPEENDLETLSSDTSISIAQSLAEVSESSSTSNATTPTTVTPTMTIEITDKGVVSERPQDLIQEERTYELKASSPTTDVPRGPLAEPSLESDCEEDGSHVKSSVGSFSGDATTSELAKRLATLHDELEELSETFERTPLMKSPTKMIPAPTKPNATDDQNSSEETITFDYDEDGGEITPPSDEPVKDEEGNTSNGIEVKRLRAKAMESSSDTIAIVSGSNSATYANRDQVRHHTESISTPLPPTIGVRMPDIINEAEVLRRQQLQIEQEIKELEQQVGFFREIPNKPPPPYIPPANGSPLALLFPAETRIDELIDGRVEELHRDRITPSNLRSDHVTNVYEKLILDMCNEFYHDLRPAEPTVSFRTIPHDKRPLVFHNPPDALSCMKDYIRAKIRRVLNDAQFALQQQQHHHQQHQLLLHHQLQQQLQQQQQQQQQHPSHSTQLQHHLLHHGGHCVTAAMPFLYGNGCASKRKPDQVDEILKQETHDDDARWTNFDREEIEVKDRITDELLKSLLLEALKDMGKTYERKMKRNSMAKRQESAM